MLPTRDDWLTRAAVQGSGQETGRWTDDCFLETLVCLELPVTSLMASAAS